MSWFGNQQMTREAYFRELTVVDPFEMYTFSQTLTLTLSSPFAIYWRLFLYLLEAVFMYRFYLLLLFIFTVLLTVFHFLEAFL